MITKRCPRCNKTKPLEEFTRDESRKNGHSCYCRLCQSEYTKEWRRKNPGYWIAKTRIVVEEKRCSRCNEIKPIEEFSKSKGSRDGRGSYCRYCQSEITTEWRRKNPEKHKKNKRKEKLKAKYSITLDNYNNLLQSQNNVCAVCGKPCSTGNRLAVDHDHKTGKVRGLLCTNCNMALGFAQDDPGLLRELADYLEYHKGASK